MFAGGLTCEEVFLCVDEVVCGLVHLDLTLPRLRHVPHPRVTCYHMELNSKQRQDLISQLAERFPCVYKKFVSHLHLHFDNSFKFLQKKNIYR